MATKRVLVIPHVGTAYGHLFRTAAWLRSSHVDDDVVVSVPESAAQLAVRLLPSRIRTVTYKIRPTVTSQRGTLNIEGFLALLKVDELTAFDLRPDMIVGDPGIRTGLLAERLRLPWEALMHGCYLPIPAALRSEECSPSIRDLAERAWHLIGRCLDALVSAGSHGTFRTWSSLRDKGAILIPNDPQAEPSHIGAHLGQVRADYGFASGRPVKCLVTVCSSGEVFPSENVLRVLVEQFGQVAVVGVQSGPAVANVQYCGSSLATSTLVDDETVVITHGGHGTLKAVRSAARVIVVPSDLDQLCNGLVAHAIWGAELAVGAGWDRRIAGPSPFTRDAIWGELLDYLDETSPGRRQLAASANQIR